MYDVILKGGTIVDGTGNPGFPAALGIRGGQVTVLRGNQDLPDAGRVIDATGLVVAPGFIDMHSHSGLMVLEQPEHLPKLTQGVTTELIGVDGISYAPLPGRDDLEDLVKHNAGLDGHPDIDLDWDTFASYLTKFDNAVSVNIATVIGNTALRICELGWDDVPADDAAVANMRAMLREGLEEGAFGLSTGLDYPPGSFATTEELGQLSKEAGRLGAMYHTHVRYMLGDRFLDPFREAFEIAEIGQCPLHLTHFYYKASFGQGSGPMFDLLDEHRRRGVDVTFDGYPYPWSSTRLSIQLPHWMQQGGTEGTMRRLGTDDARAQFKRQLELEDPQDSWRRSTGLIRVGYFARPDNQRFEGMMLADIARERKQDVADTLFDLLHEEELRINQIAPGPTETTIPIFFNHPLSMVGTDSVFIADKPSPRTYGSFPRILGEFVREESLTTLPDAIRKFTSFPAQRLGLNDRGILRDGFVADVTVFDPATVKAVATFEHPRRPSLGIEYVFVNGTLVLENGKHTGVFPGRALRRGR